MGEVEIKQFLNYLAVNRKVAAATQNQALNALVFIFRHVLQRPIEQMDGLIYANKDIGVKT